MRVVALFLAMLAVSTVVSSGQCVVKCFEPSDLPPCHRHTPSKQSPETQTACDSLMVAGENVSSRLTIFSLQAGLTVGGQMLVAKQLPLAASTSTTARWQLHTPCRLAAAVVVLRI
jgi:hypothetical protein